MVLLEGEESYEEDCPRPLHVAVQRNCREIIQMLLTYGDDINALDARGRAALYLASKLGYPEMIDVLKQRDATVEIRNLNGYAPLHASAFMRNRDVVEVVVKNGSEIDTKHTRNDWVPLHLAANRGNGEVAKDLLQYQADVDARDEQK